MMKNTSNVIKCSALAVLVGILIFGFSSASASKNGASQETARRSTPDAVPQAQPTCPEADQLRKTVQKLTTEVDRLRRRVADLERDRQVGVIQDQLNKEEDRAQAMQSRLLEISEKQTTLQTRIDEIDQQLRPENIDTALAGVGSLRPEETREAVRRKLTNERQRLQAQMDLLRQERARLQVSIAGADANIQRLRVRLNEATQPH
jgi:chromosome segregation ATPase